MAPDAEKLKILIIDDDPLVVHTLQNLLKRKGYRVESSLDGEEGVRKAKESSFDLVISDIRMPKLNGVKVVELIQKDVTSKGKKVSFMFITGYADDEALESGSQLGVSDFLLKPFDLNQFMGLVEKNLETASLEEELLLEASKMAKNRWRFPEKEFVHEKVITRSNIQGNAAFSNYFEWQEEARELLLLSHPHFSDEMTKNQDVKMVTHSAYMRFAQEARLGETIQIRVTAREVKKCSFVLVFRFYKKRDNSFLAEGWQRVAFSNAKTGKICQTPFYLLDLILPIKNREDQSTAAPKRVPVF